MDITKLSFIPQKNVRSNEASLADLVKRVEKIEPEYTMKREDDSFTFKSTFIKRENGIGYLFPFDVENKTLYLAKVDDKFQEENPDLSKGIFLYNEGTVLTFKSNYLSKIFDELFKDETLFDFEIIDDNTWKVTSTLIENVIIDNNSKATIAEPSWNGNINQFDAGKTVLTEEEEQEVDNMIFNSTDFLTTGI